MLKSKRESNEVWIPQKLPFLELVKQRLNIRIDVTHEQTLLATYERYWILSSVLGAIAGDERRFLIRLAKKYNSFLQKQI
jgi:hypothetical protein